MILFWGFRALRGAVGPGDGPSQTAEWRRYEESKNRKSANRLREIVPHAKRVFLPAAKIRTTSEVKRNFRPFLDFPCWVRRQFL